ncbi:MAG TPA: hypothetical protein DEF34_03305 [Desulfotomaculum sp.]|nr:MAG: hypothetical protein JL56_02920 [Desulfotomaculum sp. BICA1-6]HBX22655.1 hypothetical protein [Desulfotomaculum sp.]
MPCAEMCYKILKAVVIISLNDIQIDELNSWRNELKKELEKVISDLTQSEENLVRLQTRLLVIDHLRITGAQALAENMGKDIYNELKKKNEQYQTDYMNVQGKINQLNKVINTIENILKMNKYNS